MARATSNALQGAKIAPDVNDFGEDIAYDDHKIAFAVRHARGKDVLDIGCVQHNPENYRSRYWVHNALREVSKSVIGLDMYEPGVRYLRERGYEVIAGDAQSFRLDRTFDVIFAGDVIEHMDDFGGFLECCSSHLRPGGRLLISTPNPWYWRNIVKAALLAEIKTNPEHTCWLCPQTLRQLLERHGFAIATVVFGSRYRKDKWMPLSAGWKHTSFHAEAFVKV